MYGHFRSLREKYILVTSGHQVNIRGALYKHWKDINETTCDLTILDTADVLPDSLESSNGNVSSPFTPSTPRNGHLSMERLDRQCTGSTVKEDSRKEINQSTGSLRVASSSSPDVMDVEVPKSPSWSRSGNLVTERSLNKLSGIALVLQLVEDTRRELWKNMHDSYVRFRQTTTYVDYIRKVYRVEKGNEDQSTTTRTRTKSKSENGKI